VAAVSPTSPEPERLPVLSRRARVLGSVGVLLAAAAMALLGFTAERAVPASAHDSVVAPSPAASSAAASSSSAQLTTLSLSELRGHKPLP